MPELVTDGDLRAILTPDLRLGFRWVADRWIHAIEVDRDGKPFPLAWSIEADPARDDPTRVVSPAYQQLEFQKSPGGLQALVVGQSGPHHFSAVFTVEETEGGTTIGVDVADRCRAPIEALACTYWVDAVSGDLVDADSTRIQWRWPSGDLTFGAIAPSQAHLSEAGRRATRVQATGLIAPGVYTYRCLYHWRWCPDHPTA